MKVCILTFHNAMNYGAVLQCYGLQEYLKDNFPAYEVSVLDHTPVYFKKVFYDPLKPLSAYGIKNKAKAIIKYFIRHGEMADISEKNRQLSNFIHKNLKLTSEKNQDIYIAGSDQIWNLELIENDTAYLLDFAGDAKRVSYAASLKMSDVDEFAVNAYKKYLPKFDSISVRETGLVDYLKENYGVDAVSVLDPTLLVNRNLWHTLAGNKPTVSGKYLLLYYVNMPQKLVDNAFDYAKENGLEVVSLNKLKNVSKTYTDYSRASAEEFLNLIKNASVIFTTSFHGMAFSVVFEKEFFYEVPPQSYNNNDRLNDLSAKLGLEKRNIYSEIEAINWEDVNSKLEYYRNLSADFLRKALL